MIINEYRARQGARFGDETAAVIGKELDRLGTDCTAEQVVHAAKPKSSPLHPFFEWDDSRAAELHRLEQARYYIRHIDIVIVRENDERQTRAWHHINIVRDDEPTKAYVHSMEIAENDDMADQVIAKALRELNGWKVRYSEYRGVFTEIFDAIEKAKRRRKRRCVAVA